MDGKRSENQACMRDVAGFLGYETVCHVHCFSHWSTYIGYKALYRQYGWEWFTGKPLLYQRWKLSEETDKSQSRQSVLYPTTSRIHFVNVQPKPAAFHSHGTENKLRNTHSYSSSSSSSSSSHCVRQWAAALYPDERTANTRTLQLFSRKVSRQIFRTRTGEQNGARTNFVTFFYLQY
jgi:hypothetical protein